MSDLYLDLRSRIPVVAARTRIGTQQIQDAQNRTGFSNERIARDIHVSEKTWRRWKKAGEIPTASLPAVAQTLGLEIHRGSGTVLTEQTIGLRLERLEVQVAESLSLTNEAIELLREALGRSGEGERALPRH
jgi:hypothetical protein